MPHLPFPSNENHFNSPDVQTDPASAKPPWQYCKASEPPPIMFKVEKHNGHILSYAYCDLRETRLLNAGFLQLGIFGMEKYLITIEGRHLKELADLMGMGRIKSFAELGPRNFHRPEEDASIDKITIETLE